MKIAKYGLDNWGDLPRLDSHDEEGDKGVSGKHPARSCRTGGRRKRPDCFPDKGAWQRSRYVDCGTGTFISWEYRPIRTLNALWRGRHEILPSAAQTAVFDRQPKGAGRRIPESDKGTQNNRSVSGLVQRYQLYPDRRRFRLPCQIRDVHVNTVLAACQAEHIKKSLFLKRLTLLRAAGICLRRSFFTVTAAASTHRPK